MGERPITAAGAPIDLADVFAGPPGEGGRPLGPFTLRVETGQVAVLLGANGTGKTTLLRTMAGLWPARSGRCSVPPLGPGSTALLLEDPGSQFVADTLAGEIEFALENLALESGEIADRRDRLLARLELDALAGRSPATLSAGEAQRALLAASLAAAPRVLLLDDALLYLGAGESGPLWERLRDLVRSGELEALVLASTSAEPAVTADRVGLLGPQGLQAWGDPETVLRGPWPPDLEPPLAVWLERELAQAGWSLPAGGLDEPAFLGRLRAGLREDGC